MHQHANDNQSKKPWREAGPPWIAAIAAVIAATTAGGFVGRATGDDTTTRPAITKTNTVTRTVTETAGAAPGSRTAAPSPGGDVYFSGELEWGDFNLDQKEPKTVGDMNIGYFDGGLNADAAEAEVAMWEVDSVPNKDECAKAVNEDGTYYVGDLVEGN